MRPLTLAFDDAQLERDYRRPRSTGWLPLGITSAVTVLASVLGIPWMHAVAPTEANHYQHILFLLYLPLLCLILVATRVVPSGHRARAIEVASSLVALSSGLFNVTLQAAGGETVIPFLPPIHVVTILGIYSFLPTRFVYRAAFAWSVFAAYEFVVTIVTPVSSPMVVHITYIFLTAEVFGMYLGYMSERQKRRIFLQRHLLAEERAKTESLLKREVSHQVAARSRELGQMLAKIDASFVVGKLSVGDRFDTRYRVERELGAGGMGAVYEVERLTDQQRLALKIVTGEVSGASAARFAREAEIGAGVHHPNVISIVDVGIAAGVPFLAMELAPKGSLEERREKFGDAKWALPILREIAAGLAALHEAGVVHRDLKPANVLFVEGDVAKISDFGISRFGELEVGPDVDPNAPTLGATPTAKPQGLTATGMLLGTPYYMAPEAARGGRTVDAPADVFAFGILACEMLTGRAPFATPPVFLAMSGQPLPAIELGEKVPTVVLACLAEDPAKRPTMRALGEALTR